MKNELLQIIILLRLTPWKKVYKSYHLLLKVLKETKDSNCRQTHQICTIYSNEHYDYWKWNHRAFPLACDCPICIPHQVITNCDLQWKGRFWKEICEKIGMQQALTTAYYSQAVGQMEIMNQTLEISLSTNAGPNWDNWAQNLNILALSYNFMLHTAIGFTPAYLLKGYILVSGLTLIHSPDSLIPVCGAWVRHLKCRWIVNYCVVATDQIKPYMIM